MPDGIDGRTGRGGPRFRLPGDRGRRCRILIRFCWLASSSASRSPSTSSFRPSPSASAAILAVLEGLWLLQKGPGLSRPLPFLVEGLRGQLRHGRRLRPGHGLRVRHQLELFFGLCRRRHRPAAGLRGADRLLPGGRLSRRDAVRLEQGRPGAAFLRHADGRRRHAGVDDLDPGVQQLDADAAGLRDHRRPRRADRLAGR